MKKSRKKLTLWALGHSNRPFEVFLEMLKEAGIQTLVDIRTVPRSRAVPWTSQENLKPALKKARIHYVHMKILGGLRKTIPDSKNLYWRNASFRGYADYMQTEDFERGLAELLEIAAKNKTAFMCAEAVPWRCHRSLVADALTARGHTVLQLYSPGRAQPHEFTLMGK